MLFFFELSQWSYVPTPRVSMIWSAWEEKQYNFAFFGQLPGLLTVIIVKFGLELRIFRRHLIGNDMMVFLTTWRVMVSLTELPRSCWAMFLFLCRLRQCQIWWPQRQGFFFGGFRNLTKSGLWRCDFSLTSCQYCLHRFRCRLLLLLILLSSSYDTISGIFFNTLVWCITIIDDESSRE